MSAVLIRVDPHAARIKTDTFLTPHEHAELPATS
jgi:hypothetical protein